MGQSIIHRMIRSIAPRNCVMAQMLVNKAELPYSCIPLDLMKALMKTRPPSYIGYTNKCSSHA